SAPVRPRPSPSFPTRRSSDLESAEITFVPGDMHVAVEPGATLLEIAEANDMPVEAGCRMGMCGADPIGIVDGMASLSPMGDDERDRKSTRLNSSHVEISYAVF